MDDKMNAVSAKEPNPVSLLESPCHIGALALPNRFVRSATHESLAEDGAVSERLITALSRLARGRVGTIVTGAAAVAQDGRISPTQIGLWTTAFCPAWPAWSARSTRPGTPA